MPVLAAIDGLGHKKETVISDQLFEELKQKGYPVKNKLVTVDQRQPIPTPLAQPAQAAAIATPVAASGLIPTVPTQTAAPRASALPVQTDQPGFVEDWDGARYPTAAPQATAQPVLTARTPAQAVAPDMTVVILPPDPNDPANQTQIPVRPPAAGPAAIPATAPAATRTAAQPQPDPNATQPAAAATPVRPATQPNPQPRPAARIPTQAETLTQPWINRDAVNASMGAFKTMFKPWWSTKRMGIIVLIVFVLVSCMCCGPFAFALILR